MRRLTVTLATLAAALTLTGPAGAIDPYSLADLGYSVTSIATSPTCTTYSATGFGASASFGSTCDAGFQTALDGFAAGHNERKLGFQHPAAVTARASIQAKGYSVATDYGGPTFTVTGGCNVNQTATATTIVSLDASLVPAAPCPAPTTTAAPTTATASPTATNPTATTTVAVTPTVEELEARIAELEAKLAAQAAKLAALAARVDAIQRANIAAWDAWVAAAEAGLPPDEAALAARSAGLNAIYGL